MSNRLGPATFELGVIAGKRTINSIWSLLLPNPDDGKMSVVSTRLEGARDLPVTHKFMMRDKEAMRQVSAFLRDGFFER